jgi:hypothetical protein
MLVVAVAVIMSMGVICRSHVLHLDNISALRAALDRAFARDNHPELMVSICGDTSAADVVLVAERLDQDRVFHGPCISISLGFGCAIDPL